VLICDKATFPRDKPCGDGLTPRSVKWMTEMGLADELQARFHRVDTLRVVTDRRTMERRWPERPGLPDHGFVAARTELDELLLQCAADAGADVRQGTEVVEPLVEEGVVRGVMTRSPDGLEPVRARVTVAADGMSSRLGRSVGMAPRKDRPFGLAVRAQVESSRPDDAALECHATLRHNGRLLPAYGWIFPMGGGRLNVGVGYAATFRGWRAVRRICGNRCWGQRRCLAGWILELWAISWWSERSRGGHPSPSGSWRPFLPSRTSPADRWSRGAPTTAP
jgi:flavin-dependent dehydrogenase